MKLEKLYILIIESDKGSIVADKPSDVFNDSDSNELETDNV